MDRVRYLVCITPRFNRKHALILSRGRKTFLNSGANSGAQAGNSSLESFIDVAEAGWNDEGTDDGVNNQGSTRASGTQVSTRILGRRTAPLSTFPYPSPRPTWCYPKILVLTIVPSPASQRPSMRRSEGGRGALGLAAFDLRVRPRPEPAH